MSTCFAAFAGIPKGCFPVAQFDSSQKPFVAYGNAPIADLRVAADGPDW